MGRARRRLDWGRAILPTPVSAHRAPAGWTGRSIGATFTVADGRSLLAGEQVRVLAHWTGRGPHNVLVVDPAGCQHVTPWPRGQRGLGRA